MRKACLFLLLVSGPLMAQDNIPGTSGLSGYFLASPGYFNVASNRIVTGPPLTGDIGNFNVSTIFDPPENQSSIAFAFAGEINYTFAKSRTQIYFGNKLEDILRLDVPVSLGVRKELRDKSMLVFSIMTTPLTLKFWEDPFVEGEDRIKTKLSFPGLRLRWADMFGSRLELTATLREYRYDVERSGDWLIQEGRLDPNDQGLLERDGKILRLQALYKIDAGKHRFLPMIRYINDDHNGEAIANSGYTLQLSYLYRTPRLILSANILYGKRDGNEVHPVYNETFESDRIGGAFGVIVPVRVTEKSILSLTAISEILIEDTNIDFYRTEISSIILGIIWRHRRQ